MFLKVLTKINRKLQFSAKIIVTSQSQLIFVISLSILIPLPNITQHFMRGFDFPSRRHQRIKK